MTRHSRRCVMTSPGPPCASQPGGSGHLCDPRLANAVLAAQAFQHDADLLFSGMMPACGSANIPDCLFSALSGMRLIVAPQRGYDEPAILSYAISSFCPTSADGLHLEASAARRS